MGLLSLLGKLPEPTSVVSPLADVPSVNVSRTGIQSLTKRLPKVQSVYSVPMMARRETKATKDIKPTPTPSYVFPKATPTPELYPTYAPRQPQNIPETYYTGRNKGIEPSLYDAIHGSDASIPEKEMLFALGNQESEGGYNTTGDSGFSHGPYHIHEKYRKNITPEQARDPKYATRYVLDEMRRNMKRGLPLSTSLISWNSKSGRVNAGPKYDVDLPQMATTSSFWRGKKK